MEEGGPKSSVLVTRSSTLERWGHRAPIRLLSWPSIVAHHSRCHVGLCPPAECFHGLAGGFSSALPMFRISSTVHVLSFRGGRPHDIFRDACRVQSRPDHPARDSTISTPPSPSAGRSSLGTTPSTAMVESPCSPPMTSITAVPTPCCNNVNRPCATPGIITLNASFAASRNPCRFPKRSGSTHLPHPHPQQERLLSKSQSPVSQSR